MSETAAPQTPPAAAEEQKTEKKEGEQQQQQQQQQPPVQTTVEITKPTHEKQFTVPHDHVLITKAEYQSLLIGNTQSFYNSLDSHDILLKNVSSAMNLLTYQWNLMEEHKRKQLSRGGGGGTSSPP